MRKITWDFISIELTRMCQLKCRHCYKGESQESTISLETLDNLLKQTEIIGALHLTGGEPTLALEQIKFISKKLREYCIPLFYVEVVTNGFNKSEEFVDVIKEISEVVKISNMFANDFKLSDNINISVSCDRYHTEQGYSPVEAVEFYKTRLKDYATVRPFYGGNLPIATGNAKQLQESFDVELKSAKIAKRIEYLTKDVKPMCPYGRLYKLLHEEQIYVVCEMFLDVNGRMLTYDKSQDDYICNDKHEAIFNINTTEDILTNIEQFNRGKQCCLDVMKRTGKERTSFSTMLNVWVQIAKSDKALANQGYGDSNYAKTINGMMQNPTAWKPDKEDKGKYLSNTIDSVLTPSQIERYKSEILNDNDMYCWENK